MIPKPWTFRKWAKSSYHYMKGELPTWKLFYLIVRKWPSFNRVQKMDWEEANRGR